MSFMETKSHNLLWVVSYYDKLLQRYARRLTHDAQISAQIVKEVLEAQYDINQLAPGKHLRQVLKVDVCNRCFYWKQFEIFNNEPQQHEFKYWNRADNNALLN